MKDELTTPEDVASVIGELIVCKARLGGLKVCSNTELCYNEDELVTLLEAYTKLIEVMPKPSQAIWKEEVQ